MAAAKKPKKKSKKAGARRGTDLAVAEMLAARLAQYAPPIAPSYGSLLGTPSGPRKNAFLTAYAATGGNLTRAAAAAEIPRVRHYVWLKTDRKYAAAFKRAEKYAADVLEDEARRRAFEGTLEPVFYQGVLVDYVVKYSDALMLAMLRARQPAHRPQAESKSKDAPPINVSFERVEEMAALTDGELRTQISSLREEVERATAEIAAMRAGRFTPRIAGGAECEPQKADEPDRPAVP
jgi:uncharacterized small protein (DUF1192 family)